MTDRPARAADEISKFAARFIERESNRTSLVTVTGCNLMSDFTQATILVTVLPESQAEAALFFLKRQMGNLRSEISKELRLPRVPNFSVALDRGELNRQAVNAVV